MHRVEETTGRATVEEEWALTWRGKVTEVRVSPDNSSTAAGHHLWYHVFSIKKNATPKNPIRSRDRNLKGLICVCICAHSRGVRRVHTPQA